MVVVLFTDTDGDGALFFLQGSNFGWNSSIFWITEVHAILVLVPWMLDIGWSRYNVLQLFYVHTWCHKYSEFLISPVDHQANLIWLSGNCFFRK